MIGAVIHSILFFTRPHTFPHGIITPQVLPGSIYTSDGAAVTHFSLAINKKEGKDGKEKTTWYACTAFRALAEVIVEHVSKGGPLFVQGELHPRGYTDKEGIPRTSLDVLVEKFQLLSGKPSVTQEATSPSA